VGHSRLELEANGLRERVATADNAEECETLEGGAPLPDATEPDSGRSVGRTAPDPDPVETAIAAALERASTAEQWGAVEVLARELEARRKARAGVVQIDTARAKRLRKR
jgi:hypothetical protein